MVDGLDIKQDEFSQTEFSHEFTEHRLDIHSA
jgi:hypothetical protein